LTLSSSPVAGQATAPTYLATMMRAAPGHLFDLVELLRDRNRVYRKAGEAEPILLRHSQGDHWDVLVLATAGDLASYYSRERAARWAAAARRAGFDEAAYQRQADTWVSWREELLVTGPRSTDLQAAAAQAAFFHLEVFQALAGKRDSLLRQREMENDFLEKIGRTGNFIFQRVGGASWDLFTLGFYRDLAHYAEPSGRSVDDENAAAVAAGFQSRAHIGEYLRRFLASHHDTLGPIVR